MVWLKACPKCKGDLFLDEDHYGKFKSCAQCGYIRDLVESHQETAQPPRLATLSEATWLDLVAAGASEN
jgi:uncharacterized Zn finger protein (UPF0148 family)